MFWNHLENQLFVFWSCSWFNIYEPSLNVDFNFQWNFFIIISINNLPTTDGNFVFRIFLQMAFFLPINFCQLPVADPQVFLVRKKKFQANNFH